MTFLQMYLLLVVPATIGGIASYVEETKPITYFNVLVCFLLAFLPVFNVIMAIVGVAYIVHLTFLVLHTLLDRPIFKRK